MPLNRWVNVTALRIEDLPAMIKDDVEKFLETCPRSPAARLRPRMGMAGEFWLAFIGPEVREETTGIGGSPCDALEDFNRNYVEPVASRNGSTAH
jgi:hypothetical protein